MKSGFYSPYFIIPKKGSGLWPILDLRVLNRALHKLPFRMLTQRRIFQCIRPFDWFAAIDLKDAYFHVSVLSHLSRLGLQVNWEKSKLSPTQRISFLGMELDSVNLTACFSKEPAQSMLRLTSSFKKSVIIPVPKNSKPSCLNDYRPVALTSTVMKVFERLLKKHICSSIPATLDPLQFAYRPNRSTDDAISQVLHSSLTHIDSKNGNYVRLLFIDYSSAFNTIVPTKLAVKLSDLGLNTSLCHWIQDFLTARPQVVKVGQFTSNSITLNIGAPQGCVLSPLLYSLYTHDCVSSHSSTSIVKFADDTVVLGLINNDDEAAFLDEVERLTSWCQDNCLSLNVSKTKELIVDFRKRQQRPYTPLMISGTPVERVSRFKYLGVNISEDLTWTTHIQTQVKKARQRLYHLRQLRKFRVSPAILKTFYSGAIESVLTQCISVWYGNSSNQDCKALQRVVRLAERISGSALPSL